MNLRMTHPTTRHGAAEPRPSATVVPMPQAAGRRFRREATNEVGTSGQILFFTGVRYERIPDAESESEAAVPQRRRS